MGRMQLVIERAKRAYLDIDERHEQSDKLALAAGKSLPEDASDYIDLMAEDPTLLTENLVLRMAPGSVGVTPLELVRNAVLERVVNSLQQWASAADGEWRCRGCGKVNSRRETCEVCWSVRA